ALVRPSESGHLVQVRTNSAISFRLPQTGCPGRGGGEDSSIPKPGTGGAPWSQAGSEPARYSGKRKGGLATAGDGRPLSLVVASCRLFVASCRLFVASCRLSVAFSG